jgi:hypothetical protein
MYDYRNTMEFLQEFLHCYFCGWNVHFVKDGGDMFQRLHDALGAIVVTTLGIQQ